MMDDSTTAEIETGETTIFAYLRALARVRAADPLVARLSADTLDVAKRRAAACSQLYGRLRRSSRLRAQRLALGTWYVDESGPIALWQAWSDDVQGRPLDAGHFFAEEAPEQTAEALSRFFGVV